ncbi:MAG: hypothetical protein KAJ62_07075 [Desulfobacteraceae bacterium]|nr:hypothetical protein [Desulfobacteraceae bacterium]
MTLVVARIVEENIYIESDSKITDERLVRSDPLCGLLKTLILHPFICVSFAGNVHFAELALKKFFDQRIGDINILLSMLREINLESDNSTDFIVATILGRVPRLFKVSDGTVTKDIEHAWIGDHEGFEIYQKETHSIDDDIPLKDKMQKAFRSVIDNSDLTTIGDFHISTSLNHKINPGHPVFLHDLKIEIDITEPQTIRFKKKSEPQPIPLGTTAGGSHGISYLNTVSPEFHGVAIHFTHGNFGVLFCPQLDLKGIIINNVKGRDFVDKINYEFNIPLQGFIKMNDTAIQYVDTRNL